MEIPVPFLKKRTGLGDAVKAATTAVGIPACGGCGKRAEKLNAKITFVPPDENAAALPPARLGASYRADMPGMVVGGSIPPGMRFIPELKQVQGVPLEAGEYGLVVVVGNKLEHFKLEVR